MISAFLYGIHNAGGWVVDNDYIHNYHRDIHECYTMYDDKQIQMCFVLDMCVYLRMMSGVL